MKFFFDNCISYKYAEMLRALGEDVTALREKFPEDTKDIPLFEQLRGHSVVFVTTNTTQLTRKQEAKALKQSGNTALFLGPFFERLRFWDQAVWLLRQWPRICGFANGVVPGTCAEIKQNGKALIYPL